MIILALTSRRSIDPARAVFRRFSILWDVEEISMLRNSIAPNLTYL